MSKDKWNTPTDFRSDGCTIPGPSIFKRIMGADRYRDVCRRHDFECRYSLYDWKSARKHMLKGVRRKTPFLLRWRIPIFWIALYLARKKCKWTHPGGFPERWEYWRDRTNA